ncbi:hypothetical protein DFH01_13735 [Falsiroseomonas bella]|uniref:DUF2029 domain-containing protein n=1 Tax=Falsiroseomonas bella TaxID=2184016 RepID=A0A317FB02_9PROT|nr:DUF6311 domain-containing protein [Falsiroseomonas bella]PWS36244.1 hypothetical protein DFH01_13735 [Falsiroseomonas bella]
MSPGHPLDPMPPLARLRPAAEAAARPDRMALQRICRLLVLLGGASAAILALGPRILDIRDTGWLLHGTLGPDPVAYWLAWRYFSVAPWTLPLGLNPAYGLELASAIFFVDVVPLAAFIAKALLPVVEIKQYWGPWLVLSAMLQGAMAWRLLALSVEDPVSRAFGALLFVFQPLLLNRYGGHFALASQWALLWALWLCLRPAGRRQALQWAGCLGLVAMLNPYVLAMCAGLWVSDLAARGINAGRIRPVLGEALGVPAAGLAGLWLAGYFTVRGEVEPMGVHYGHSQLDLTAPFDAVEWGRLLPALPGLRHWEHGGAYLGAGALAVLAVAAMLAWRGGLGGALRRHRPLLVVLGGMLLFAISNRVAVGGHVLVEIPLPAPVMRLADMLRASERFYWPLGYAALFGAVSLVALRLPIRAARIVLGVALALQVVDVDAGMAKFRALVAEAPRQAAERLPDPFWSQAALRYGRVRAVPAANFGADWEPVARFAARHRLPTDVVYLSRVEAEALRRLNARTVADFDAGRWERGTLYVLRDEGALRLVERRANPSRDLLTVVDGLQVFAPDWHTR